MPRDLTARSQKDTPDNYEYRTATDLSQPQLNWTNATDKITETIGQIQGDRQRRRDETNQYTNESLDALSAATELDNVNYNQNVMEMGYQGSDLLYGYYNQIGKNGYTQRQYKADVQNVLDGMSAVKDVYTNIETYYTDITDRTEANTNNIFEQYLGNSLLGYTNAGNFRPMFDPNGNVVMVQNRYDQNGKLLPPSLEDRDATQSVNTMRVKMDQRSDYVNVFNNAAPLIDQLGTMIDVQIGAGQSALSIEDWTQKEYTDPITGETITNDVFLNNLVTELTQSPEAKISILQTYHSYGEENFTEDPDVAARDKSKVLVQRNPNRSGMSVMVFNEEQEEQIKQTGKQILLSGIDYEEKFTKGLARGSSVNVNTGGGLTQDERNAIGYVKQLNSIVSGNQDQSNAAFDAVKDSYNASNPENQVVSARREMRDGRQQYVIRYEDQTEQVVDSRKVDGSDKTPENIEYQIYGKLNYTGSNVEDAFDLYRKQGGAFGTDIGEGPSGALETTQFIPAPDFESNVTLSFSYIDKDGAVQYTDETNPLEFLGGLKQVPIAASDVPLNADNLQRYARAVVNEPFLNNVGLENITVTSTRPFVYDIKIGDQTKRLSAVDGKKIGREINKLIEKETKRVNESVSAGRGMDKF